MHVCGHTLQTRCGRSRRHTRQAQLFEAIFGQERISQSPPRFRVRTPTCARMTRPIIWQAKASDMLDEEREVLRKDLIELIDMFLADPEHIQPTKGWLECRIELIKTSAEAEQFKDASSLSKTMVDEQFVLALLLRHTGLNTGQLKK